MFFAVLLLVFAFGALRQGQSVIMPELLIVPLIAIVLSFAARRQINNSEGTRIGIKFCNQAWWIAVIGGFGYLAYLGGIYYAINSDARTAFRNWSAAVVKVNPLERGTSTSAPPCTARCHRTSRRPWLPQTTASCRAWPGPADRVPPVGPRASCLPQ